MAPRFYDGDWRSYVPMSARRRNSARALAALRRAGRDLAPVEIAGRKITTSFWGDAWCRNLESYSDYANRLPRGRTYVRNGSVIDLRIEAGTIAALVSGSEIYEIRIQIAPLPPRRWKTLQTRCSGRIESVVELLRGSLSRAVMGIVTEKGKGLFPAPKEISLDCSCPDWAALCKHLAATLYGVGSRLDRQPELLFALRGVDPLDLVAAAVARPTGARGSRRRSSLASDGDLASVFGIELEGARKKTRSPKKPGPKEKKPTGSRRSEHSSSRLRAPSASARRTRSSGDRDAT